MRHAFHLPRGRCRCPAAPVQDAMAVSGRGPGQRRTLEKQAFLALPPRLSIERSPPDLYREVGPLVAVLAGLGAWRVSAVRRASDEVGAEYASAPWCSVRMVASALLLASLTVLSCVAVRSNMVELLSGQEPFLERVILVLHIVYETLPLSIPLLHLPAAADLALYFNNWVRLQSSWHWVTGSPLRLESGRRARTVSAVIVVYSVLSPVYHQRVSRHMPMWKLPIYPVTVALAIVLGSLWHALNTEVVATSVKLRALFHQRRTSRRGLTGDAVRGYCMLWLRLRALTQELGGAWGAVILHALVTMMVMAMTSVFGLLSALQHGLWRRVISTIASVVWGVALIFWICGQAHLAARSVRMPIHPVSREMLLELLTMPLRTLNDETSVEVMRFVQVLSFKPVRVNLKGFVVATRELSVASAATITTYIVVLAQLALTISAGLAKPSPESHDVTPSNRSG
ncbi:Gustatory and odorant receptor 63a [Frankliniella fusca]|uniref:Gustatory receptor n=1 Tax=Frankliniella fusca TaxID=407009 RepID=A0AAE1I1M1_9NEOP|nr:Gustatory and odorant receptor 63a [Frankliniella fusca]